MDLPTNTKIICTESEELNKTIVGIIDDLFKLTPTTVALEGQVLASLEALVEAGILTEEEIKASRAGRTNFEDKARSLEDLQKQFQAQVLAAQQA